MGGFREGIERTTSKGETILIKRPNHDLTHGVRKAMLTMDLIDTIVQTQAQSQTHSALQIWLNQRLNSDPLFRKKLQLAAIWQRAGRHSEASGGDAPNEYGRYCDDSAQYFATAAKKHLPEITDKELNLFCKVIQQYNFKEGTEPPTLWPSCFPPTLWSLTACPGRCALDA